MSKIAQLISTFFYVGKIPKAPGTFGSIMAYPIFVLILLLLPRNQDFLWLSLAFLLIFFVGIWASGTHCKKTNTNDPGEIVIDEVAGQFLTLLLIFPAFSFFKESSAVLLLFLPFVTFRLFDVLKPWPINIIDSSVKGGLGVMLDDVAAAMMAAMASYGILFLMK